MTYRVAAEIEGTALAAIGRKAFHPHLTCSWTLDPASHRLSCAWAAPAAELGAWPSSAITAATLSPGFALQPRS
jgi:hypothetical protein